MTERAQSEPARAVRSAVAEAGKLVRPMAVLALFAMLLAQSVAPALKGTGLGLGRVIDAVDLVSGVSSHMLALATSALCIGLLLTDALLPPDATSGLDPCGSCDACLRACPTGALHDGQGLQAPRCLSYLTTASHDPIPADLRPKLGLRVYGCDDCQSSCPWNLPPRLHGHAPHPNLEGDASVARATLESWLGMPSRQLRRTLAGTALHWLSPRALRRTACVVLGNLGYPSSRPALERAAQESPDPQLGDHAAWALSRLPPAHP